MFANVAESLLSDAINQSSDIPRGLRANEVLEVELDFGLTECFVEIGC